MDDPRYEGFAGKTFLVGGVPKHRPDKKWQTIRMAPTWKPVEVYGRVRKFNDFPGVGLMPAFSERAVNALRNFLEPNGELLPLKSSLGCYFAYNVTTIIDALNVKQSQIDWLTKPAKAFEVERYKIFPKKIEGHSIFHMPETGSTVYVTEPFVRRVQEYGLQGMWFPKIWPLPPGMNWGRLARQQRDKLHTKGLPPGQTVKGNAMIIQLFLANPNSKGTATEKKAIAGLMDEIDGFLVDLNSSNVSVGSLEGHDYGIPGECRLFLSCPDADALVKKLRPWLKSLHWKAGITVTKQLW